MAQTNSQKVLAVDARDAMHAWEAARGSFYSSISSSSDIMWSVMWEVDTNNCSVCDTRFSRLGFNLRHHCRSCGLCICWTCTRKRVVEDGDKRSVTLVCTHCSTSGDVPLTPGMAAASLLLPCFKQCAGAVEDDVDLATRTLHRNNSDQDLPEAKVVQDMKAKAVSTPRSRSQRPPKTSRTLRREASLKEWHAAWSLTQGKKISQLQAEEAEVSTDMSQSLISSFNLSSMSSNTSCWSVEQSFMLCTWSEFSKHAGKAPLVDPGEISSIAACVEQLNSGLRTCEKGVCIVYSSSLEAYCVLYDKRSKSEAHQLFPKVTKPVNVGDRPPTNT